jgi:ParB-like nuclease domain
MKIHPSHCFPLLPDDELQYLAQDIKKNGLFKPIIVDDEGQLVDGRNRLLACEIAGVEPRFEKMPAGWDARDYMLSVNLIRKRSARARRRCGWPWPSRCTPMPISLFRKQALSENDLNRPADCRRQPYIHLGGMDRHGAQDPAARWWLAFLRATGGPTYE